MRAGVCKSVCGGKIGIEHQNLEGFKAQAHGAFCGDGEFLHSLVRIRGAQGMSPLAVGSNTAAAVSSISCGWSSGLRRASVAPRSARQAA